ncbi:phage holin family protein [Paenibacillus agricola]|uniref:Phage holin family protein n=1 Tax=Paenibacillus agricola TaxID=2716264 RepID=A0ABX0JDW2_9BACL|nr:phage holin family protein [Paenibacillus agricola]NHN33580.1 phage holin family protein [Paenibacillus agricola]
MTIKLVLGGLLTAVIGTNEKIAAYSGILSILGFITSSYLGGWDIGLRILVFCMVSDYLSGVAGAIKNKKLDAEVMFWGGIKKAVILAVLALSILLDEFVGNDAPAFRTLAIYFYVGKEALSVIQNFGILGVNLPSFIVKEFTNFEKKGDGIDGKGN